MRFRLKTFGLVLSLLCMVSGGVWAQDPLTLVVRRDFGYSSGQGQIRGDFHLEVSSAANLTRVTYLIDEQVIGTASEGPFRVDFNTTDYADGWHEITARGELATGEALTTTRRVEFVTADAEWQAVNGILIPLVAGLGGLVALFIGASVVLDALEKRKTTPLGAPRSYGFLGGAICPKCGRPFAVHLFSFNVVVGKLDRCDHCGQWSIVRRASRAELTAAEQAELKLAEPETPISEMSAEEKLKKQVDESRFLEG